MASKAPTKCYANYHLTPEEFGFWEVCRSLSFKFKGKLIFDGRHIAAYFGDTGKNTIYRLAKRLQDKGWFVCTKKTTRDKHNLQTPTEYQVLSWYNFVGMKDHGKEKWFDLYRTALLELERAAMTWRIGDARAEIAVRLEVIKAYPGLHQAEHEAIRDALNNLRTLEREEAHLAEEEKKRLLQEAAQFLQGIAHRFQEPGQDNSV
jgi:hypothetical protein